MTDREGRIAEMWDALSALRLEVDREIADDLVRRFKIVLAALLRDPEPNGPQCQAINPHGAWCCLLSAGHDGPHRHNLEWDTDDD